MYPALMLRFFDILVWRESTDCLETASEVVSCREVCELGAQLIMAAILELFNRRVLDRAGHSLNISVDLWAVGFVHTVLRAVRLADCVEALVLD